MKHLLLTTIAAVVLVGCGSSVDIHQADRISNSKAIESNRMGKLKIIIASIIALNLLTSCDWHFGVNGWTPPSPPHNPMPPPASILDAAKYGDIEAAKQFLANGSNVNARNGQNRTPLHMAALIGYKEIVELLITNDADVNAKDNKGKTPMDAANVTNHTEIADLLRKHGGKTGEELKAEGK